LWLAGNQFFAMDDVIGVMRTGAFHGMMGELAKLIGYGPGESQHD